MVKILKGKYRHFKGKLYDVIAIARDCDNPDKIFVVYRALWENENFGFGQIWIRDIDDFCGEKILEDGSRIKKFVFIGEKDEG